jgi:lipoprotein-anchoring transpeptidase ErfK/SrfK
MRRSRAALAAGAVAAAVSAAVAVPAGSVDGSSVLRHGSVVARPRGSSVSLRAAPGSANILATVESRTEFGSTTTLPVVSFQGRWLEVISSALPNGVHGFVRTGETWLRRDPLAIDVDLSARRLRVWRDGVVERRVHVAIGAPSTPTPIGQFAVTDELTGLDPAAYGCCILALSGHQTRLPTGWPGGDRLAIHGGGGIGSAVSSGCLHAAEPDLRWLIDRVPLGTQVMIHP